MARAAGASWVWASWAPVNRSGFDVDSVSGHSAGVGEVDSVFIRGRYRSDYQVRMARR